MTIGELIAQLRTIQDIFGDLPVWLYGASQVIEANYKPGGNDGTLPNRAELRVSVASATLSVDVSDDAVLGEQLA